MNYSESREQHSTLIDENWKHTQTLNYCMYIEYLHNWCENVSKEIKLLSKPKL